MNLPPTAMEEKLTQFCNVFLSDLGLQVEQVGLVRFLGALGKALTESGLRIAEYSAADADRD